jgi:hypothetical protein
MKSISLLVGFCIGSGWAFAQGDAVTPRAEVGFNYTYFHGTTAQSTDFNQNGGSAYVEYNVNRVVGLVADFGGYANGRRAVAGDSGTTFSYLLGPRFNWRKSRLVPYVQFLFGGSNASLYRPSGSVMRNGFTTAAGGGFDWVVSKHIALKPVQVEYVTAQLPEVGSNSNSFQNNLRYSGGIVFRFGEK